MEHFLAPSPRRDTHLFGGLGLMRRERCTSAGGPGRVKTSPVIEMPPIDRRIALQLVPETN